MRLPSIDPFLQESEKRIIWHVGSFFVTNEWRWKISREKFECCLSFLVPYTQYYKHFLIICWKVRLFLFAGVFWECHHCAIVIFFKWWNLLKLRRVPDNIIKIISFSKPLVLFWEKKIVIDEGNAWRRMDVYLGKNNLFVFLPMYRIYRYISLYISDIAMYIRWYIDWSTYLFRFAIPNNAAYELIDLKFGM